MKAGVVWTRFRQHGALETGFTLVEVLVAMLLVGVALMAVAGSFDIAGKSALAAQRHEQAVAFGQREIERIRALDWADIGMSAMPVHEGIGNPPDDPSPQIPSNPNYYVNGGNLLIKASYRDTASGPAGDAPPEGEPFVDGGGVSPGPQAFSAGATTGRIYRYVTWRAECVLGQSCDGEERKDSKRITIAIALDASGNGAGPAKPIWLSTIATDPDAKPPGVDDPDANPGTGADVTAQPFFLYDTPCHHSLRQPIAASHATHDTAQSGATCSTASKPDLMGPSSGPPYDPEDPVPPLYDYSSDLLRTAPAGGLVLKKHDAGCPTSYSSGEAGTRKRTLHSWATAPFADAFSTTTEDARVGFSFWTQTVDGVAGDGELCLVLRRMTASGSVSTLVSGTYEQSEWPQVPTELTFTLPHDAFTINAGQRLLLTVSLKSSSTNDIALFYDHVSYQSFLTVRTTTPLVE